MSSCDPLSPGLDMLVPLSVGTKSRISSFDDRYLCTSVVVDVGIFSGRSYCTFPLFRSVPLSS